jgi:hypothetical protein
MNLLDALKVSRGDEVGQAEKDCAGRGGGARSGVSSSIIFAQYAMGLSRVSFHELIKYIHRPIAYFVIRSRVTVYSEHESDQLLATREPGWTICVVFIVQEDFDN